MKDLQENLFPDPDSGHSSAPPEPVEEAILRIPGAILNLIDRHYSVELASGEFSVVRLRQGDSVLSVLARVGEEIQWPLARDVAAVKLDGCHYFFSLRLPPDGPHRDYDSHSDEEEKGKSKSKSEAKSDKDESENVLNCGLTIASKGQEGKLTDLAGLQQLLRPHGVGFLQGDNKIRRLFGGFDLPRGVGVQRDAEGGVGGEMRGLLDHAGPQRGGLQRESCKAYCVGVRAADQGDTVVRGCHYGQVEVGE